MNKADFKTLLYMRYDELTAPEQLEMVEGAIDILMYDFPIRTKVEMLQKIWSTVQNKAEMRRRGRK